MTHEEMENNIVKLDLRLRALEETREQQRVVIGGNLGYLQEFFLRGPGKINAIKLVRALGGMSLKDAKEWVEQFPQYRVQGVPGAYDISEALAQEIERRRGCEG